MTKRKIRSAPGVLGVVMVCLVGSALIRVLDPEAAIATEMASLSLPEIPRNIRDTASSTPAPQTEPDLQQCSDSAEVGELMAALSNRADRLKAREAAVEDRAQALRVAEAKLKENLAALVEAERNLAATLALADSAAEQDLERLTIVYQTMKPKTAAALFQEMPTEFAAGFLARMKPANAAQIMSKMDSATAYGISVIMAGRNAAAPTE